MTTRRAARRTKVLSLYVTEKYLRVRRYAGGTPVPAPDLRLIISALLGACGLFLVALAINQTRPGPAIVMGSISLALYCLALLLFNAVCAHWPGLGLAIFKIGSWSLLWVAVTFGLATITWVGPQSGDAAQIELSSVFRALWLMAAAMTAFTCGYCAGPRAMAEHHIGRFLAIQQRRFSGNIRSPWVPWALFLIGTAMQVALAVSTGRFGYVGDAAAATTTAPGYEQLLAVVTYLAPLSVAAAAARAYQIKGFQEKFTVIFLFIAEVTIGAVSGVKQGYLVAILAVLAPRVTARRRMPVGAIAVAIVVFMLVVIPFNEAYRSDARGSTMLSTSQAITAAPGIFDEVLSGASPSVIASSGTYIAQRIREIDSPAIIIQRTPGQIPYSSPVQLVVAPIIDMIPRELWPGKPILAVSYDFSQQYFELPPTAYTSTAITPEGDLYRHGGLIFVLAGMCLLGWGVRILDDLLDVRESLQAAFFVIIAAPELVNSETDWVTLLAGFPALVIVWLLAIRISFHRNEPAQWVDQ